MVGNRYAITPHTQSKSFPENNIAHNRAPVQNPAPGGIRRTFARNLVVCEDGNGTCHRKAACRENAVIARRPTRSLRSFGTRPPWRSRERRDAWTRMAGLHARPWSVGSGRMADPLSRDAMQRLMGWPRAFATTGREAVIARRPTRSLRSFGTRPPWRSRERRDAWTRMAGLHARPWSVGSGRMADPLSRDAMQRLMGWPRAFATTGREAVIARRPTRSLRSFGTRPPWRSRERRDAWTRMAGLHARPWSVGSGRMADPLSRDAMQRLMGWPRAFATTGREAVIARRPTRSLRSFGTRPPWRSRERRDAWTRMAGLHA